MSPIHIENKNIIKNGIIFLYTLCIKYMKQYAKIFNYEIPSNKIFIQIKNWVDNNLNIKEELEKIYGNNNFEVSQDKEELFNKFKNEIIKKRKQMSILYDKDYRVVNMDETGMLLEMAFNTTIDFKGNKYIDRFIW